MIIDQDSIEQEVASALQGYGLSFTAAGVAALADQYVRSKAALVRLLRRHAHWNERALAVVLPYTQRRVSDGAEARRQLGLLREWGDDYLARQEAAQDGSDRRRFFLDALQELSGDDSHLADDALIARLQRLARVYRIPCFKGLRAGQRKTRLVMKIAAAAGISAAAKDPRQAEALRGFHQYYAKFADALSPYQADKTLLLSVHPCDYLLMSHGSGWESCHKLNGGAYRGGTLSYLLDEVSLVLYLVDAPESDACFWQLPKLQRQLFCYQDGLLLQSRIYPQNALTEQNAHHYRQLVADIIDSCLSSISRWICANSQPLLSGLAQTHPEAAHYEDYRYAAFAPMLMRRQDKPWSTCRPLTIGHASLCLLCGQSFDGRLANGDLLCPDCLAQTTTCHCAACGIALKAADALWIGGQVYCASCLYYCDYHEDYELVSQAHASVSHYGTVCLFAITTSGCFCQCTTCGAWHIQEEGAASSAGSWQCRTCAAKALCTGDETWRIYRR